MSQPETESYTAAKGGISALTHALSVSLAGKVRVNSISPEWIDTNYTVFEGADAVQQPAGRVGNPSDIANMVLYLCSDMAGFITGENICIDGGMTKQMILGHQTFSVHNFKDSSFHFSAFQHLSSPGTIISYNAEKAQLKLDFFDRLYLPLWGRGTACGG